MAIKFTGFNKTSQPYFRTVPNESVSWSLKSLDGKDFGKVSYEAYKAVEEFKLDSYKPKNKNEEDILNKFRSHRDIPVYDEAKRNIGYISYDASMAIKNFKLDSYKPKDEGESTVLENLRKQATIPLEAEVDGKIKSYGNISYDAYVALQNDNINESKLSESDKATLSNYYKAAIHPLKIEVDGKEKTFGNVSLNTLKLMGNEGFDYDLIPQNERQVVSDYFEYMEEISGPQYESPDNFWEALEAIPYTVEKAVAGVAGGVENLFYGGAALMGQGFTTMSRAFDKVLPGDGSFVTNVFDATTKHFLNIKTVGESLSEDAESRFAVPSWYRTYVGTTAEAFGNILPALATEYFTAGASPMGDAALANYFSKVTAGKSLVNTIKSSLTTIKPSDIVFGGSAMGSAAKSSYRETGDVGKSLNYGVLNGLGEVVTEKLFGGLAGTGSGSGSTTVTSGNRILKVLDGADDLIDLSKIKGISKLASTKYGKKVLDIALEGVEEMIMSDLDPWMQRATINPDAEKTTWKERGESALQGILLSGFSNAASYAFEKINNIPSVKELNVITQNINDTLPDGVSKLNPLKITASNEEIVKRAQDINRIKGISVVNQASGAINTIMNNDQFELLTYDATAEEIQERQNQIKVFTTGYADLAVEQLVQNNPEIFAEIIDVGDVFKDSKTGNTITVINRDTEQTTVQINNGEKAETRVMPNSKALSFFTNGQLAWVSNSEGVSTETTVAEPTSTVTEPTTTITDTVSVGDSFVATKSGNTAIVIGRDAESTTLQVAKKDGIETRTISNNKMADYISNGQLERISPVKSTESVADTTNVNNESNTPIRDINLKRVGRYYEVYGEEAQILAEALDGVETTKAVVNGVETDLLRLPADLAKKSVNAFSDEFNLILSDNPTSTEVENAIVTDETAITDETIPVAPKSATEVKISDVVSAIEETLTPEAKENLQNGDVNANYNSIAETLIGVYQDGGTIDDFTNFFVDGGKKVESVIKGEIDNTVVAESETTTETNQETEPTIPEKETVAKVLKNESTSDTIESKSETTPVESEDNGNESVREDLLHGNGKRGNDGSTRKQAERLLSFGRKNQGRDATERQNFTRELIERGQVKETTIANCKTTLINPEAYNDDMKSMVEEAKRNGIELRFVAGTMDSVIELDDGRKITKRFRGIQLSPTKILVQYDNAKSPQMIAKHEIIHAKWNTPEVQAIKDTILDSLTEEDKQDILSQARYQHYMEAYKNDKDAVWQEFICDVMSGDTYYYADYIDIVNDYWYGNETIEGYNAADYATSKDAGGKYDIDEDSKAKSHKKAIEQYTEKDYRNFGWARANNILNAGQNADYRSKFADAKVGRAKFEKSKQGEYIIPVSDIYDKSSRGINNVLVFAKGTISNPVITSVIEIHADDETHLDIVRRNIYELEWRGIQQETGGIIQRYYGSDFADEYYRRNSKHGGHNNDNGVGERNSTETQTTQEETGVRYDLDDADSEYMEAVESGDTESASKMVDEAAKSNGYTVKAYHGTSRADRVGNVFRPDRATSGPMAYFTDSKEIATNYARDKADTSLAYDEEYDSYYTQFRVNRGGKSISIPELWNHLSISEKTKIKELAGQIKFDEDYENIIVDKSEKHGNGAYDAYTLNMHKGNVLEALVDTWLETGDLYRREADFLEVLKLVGIEDAEYRNPDARYEKVYDTWLKIQKPFDTELANKSFYDSLSKWIESHDMSVYEKETSNADMWDKNNQTPETWLDKLNDDIESGTTHAWTVIPDFVTDYLKEQKYDGIKDKGGKNGGESHIVWIPFSSEQIKSAEPVTYDDKGNVVPLSERFNKNSNDIRYDIDEDSDGNTLTEEQVEFFKDSQARDKDGKLKVLYHGSPNEFDVFDKNKSGKRGTFASAKLGFYFTDDITYAKMMGNTSDKKANVFKAYLNIKKPLRVLTTELFDEEGVTEIEKQLKGGNYDGIIDELGNYVVFESNQIKLTDNTKPTESDNIRYDLSEPDKLETQKKIEKMAKEITSHEEFISLTKQNTKEFVDKIKENENLQKRLHNAKRQMALSPAPNVNTTLVGKVTKDILTEMDSTLKATDLKERVTSIYNEYFAEMKKAKGVESKVKEANDSMMNKFAELAVDIADSSVAYTESADYGVLKAYIKDTRIRIPESAKSDAHYAEFRKSHMGTFNLTNDGLEMDVVYQELCDMFPGLFDTEITHPADQLNAIAETLENLKPYAYNPFAGYMEDAIDHIVYRFASEVDGLAAMPKTKAQKIAEKGAYDKEMALEKERANFERKLDRHKKNSEKTIQALQKKIGDSEYVRYWEKRLSKEEKAQAVNKVREKQKVAVLKTKIRNIVADMKKKLDKTEKNGGYPKELVQAVADVCSVIDFHTDRTNKDGTPTKVSLKLDALKMQYDALKNSPNYDFQTEYSDEISNRILKLHQKIENKRVVDLTFDELSQLKEILGEINHSLATASEQIGKANTKANYEIATEIIEDLQTNNKAISEFKNSLLREMKLAKESGKAFVINPHRVFEMISNYDKNSEFYKLYEGLLQGERDRKKFTMDATMPFDELTDGGGNEIAFYDFRTKLHKTGIKFEDGTDVEIPKSIICEIIMLWERKQGRTHLEAGGFKIPDLKLFNKGKTAESLAVGKKTNAITQADITRLRGMLDSYDKAWINRAYYLFNNVAKNAINETSMQLLGREIAKADNYIRIYVDSDFVNKDIGKNENDITIEGHGSLKETTPDAKNPVVLRGLHENVFEHIDFSAKYYGLAIPIRNFNKVYKISINVGDKSQSIRSMLGSTFGPKIRDGVVVQVIKDLQSPRPREISMFNKVRGKWLTAVFWGNIKSTLKQTTSYWTSSSILDESSLIKGVGSYFKHRKQTKAEIAKYSGTLYSRSQGLSTTELGDRANRKRLAELSSKTTKFINEKLPALRKVPEWIRPGNWLQSMDCATSSALWDACKHQVSKTMNESEDGYMKAVADLYERVIEETQSNYDMLHRPEILKSTNPVNQTLGMFQNDNLQQTGIMYGAFNNLKAKQKAYKADKSSVNEQNLKDAKKRMDKAIRARIYSSLWMALIVPLADTLLRKFKPYIDEEDKEITSSSVLEQMMLNMAEDTFGIFVPVVGQLVTKAMDTFNEGYDFLNDPSFDVMEDFIKATSKIWKAYEEDGDVLKALVDAVPAISNMTGIPAKNISDLYKAVKGYIGDIKEGKFAHDLEEYTSGNKSFYNYGDLASYIVSGDKEKETKWNDYYSANGKEFAKGSLTKEIKPAYVQMYLDSPEKAYNIKKKLILDYDYTEADIDDWFVDEYLKHIVPGKKFADKSVSNPEYAAEIKGVLSNENKWDTTQVFKTIRSYYKAVYKEGDEKETNALRKALLDDGVVTESNLEAWENKADNEIKKQENKLNAEKEKFKD